MIPESPTVCFRCKKCKACFLTMQDINRHLYKENHYIKRSSGSSSSNNNNTMSSVTTSNGSGSSSDNNNTTSSETSSNGGGSSSGDVNLAVQKQSDLTSTEIKKTDGDNLASTEIKETNGEQVTSTEVKKTNGENLPSTEVKEANGEDTTSTEIAASIPNGTSPKKVENTPVLLPEPPNNVSSPAPSTRKVTMFTCSHCGKKFPLLNTLRNHSRQAHSKLSSQSSKEDQILKTKTRKRKRTSDAVIAAAANNFDETNRRLRSRESKGEPSQTPNHRQVRSNSKLISPNTKEPQVPKIKRRKRSTCDTVIAAAATNLSERNLRLRSRESKGEPDEKPKSPTNDQKPKAPTLDQEPKSPTPVQKPKSTTPDQNPTSPIPVQKLESKPKSPTPDQPKPSVSAEHSPEDVKPNINQLKEQRLIKLKNGETEVITIQDEPECIETPESILAALNSTFYWCPLCKTNFEHSAGLTRHLKICLDNYSEVDENENQPNQDQSALEDQAVIPEVNGFNDDSSHSNEENNQAEAMDEDQATETEGESSTSSSKELPYYQREDYRRCWVCEFVVARFYNLKKHLAQVHKIKMSTNAIHMKQERLINSPRKN